MKGFDAFAGVIKSGGKTRRAAKMVILNAEHPGHRRVHQLQGRGREEGLGADRRRLRRLVHRPGVLVGVLPELEQQRARDRRVHARGARRRRVGRRKAVRDGAVDGHLQGARPDAADRRGRRTSAAIPGMQFDTTINDWHTCPNTARINASNPCSEYMFLDDSACNLASINLMKFVQATTASSTSSAFKAACRDADHGAGDHRRQRELSDAGDREEQPRLPSARPRLREPRRAADVARPALRQRRRPRLRGGDHRADDGEAYAQSARIARDHGGPFAGYEKNREPFLRVMRKHRDAMQATSTRATCRRICYDAAQGGRGTMRSSSASSTATATRRRRCWRRPAPSAS